MTKTLKCCLNLLIVFYLGVIYFAGVPESNTLNFRLKQKALNVAWAVGIWPSWSMFAPNPIRFDTKSYVEIVYQNGKRVEFDIEKEPKGVLAPFRKARWMKYSQDNLRNPDHKILLKPAMRFYARKYSTPENPVVDVIIKRKWYDLEPFSEHGVPPISKTPRTEGSETLISLHSRGSK